MGKFSKPSTLEMSTIYQDHTFQWYKLSCVMFDRPLWNSTQNLYALKYVYIIPKWNFYSHFIFKNWKSFLNGPLYWFIQYNTLLNDNATTFGTHWFMAPNSGAFFIKEGNTEQYLGRHMQISIAYCTDMQPLITKKTRHNVIDVRSNILGPVSISRPSFPGMGIATVLSLTWGSLYW